MKLKACAVLDEQPKLASVLEPKGHSIYLRASLRLARGFIEWAELMATRARYRMDYL